MTCINVEIKRALKSKWVYIAIAVTFLLLLFEISDDMFLLFQGVNVDRQSMLQKAFTGKGNMIALPMLAAIPYAATPFQEIRSKVVRFAVFRTGFVYYVLSKLIAVVVATAFSQAVSSVVFGFIVVGVENAFFHFVIARSISAVFFALVGSIGALFAKDAVFAYALPVALCFSLSMLNTRFFAKINLLNPLSWLNGTVNSITLSLALVIVVGFVFFLFMYREVKSNA